MTLVAFFTTTLIFSMAGIVALLGAKRFEVATGRVVLGEVRPKIGAFFHSLLTWVERVFPALLSRSLKRGVSYASWFMHNGVARGVLVLERVLERTLAIVRYATAHPSTQSAGKASAFLQEVAEHKKKLLKRSHTTNLSVN